MYTHVYTVMVGPDKLVSSHQQGIRITCLAYHLAIYAHVEPHGRRVLQIVTFRCDDNVANQTSLVYT